MYTKEHIITGGGQNMDQQGERPTTAAALVYRHVQLFKETVVPWQTISGLAWLFSGVFCCNQPVHLFSDWTVVPLLIALISIRFSGMCWNNLIDWQMDALNPRTRRRAVPSGRLSPQALALYALMTLLVFLVSCSFLPFVGQCMGIVLAVAVLLYSFTKRVTYGCHFVLGLIYACLPLAGAIWQSGTVPLSVLFLSLAALCSVSGADILYAFQDVVFDRRLGLYSVPARFGEAGAKETAAALHGTAVVGCSFGLFKSGVGLIGFGVWGVALATFLVVWRIIWMRSTDCFPKFFPVLLVLFPIATLVAFLLDRAWNTLL
jgi:4-hydroxybenzoate polyprenyltransferase